MAKAKKIEEEVEVSETEIKQQSTMDKILDATATPPGVDDVVEGKVIGIEKDGVFIDIPPFGTGIIYGREYINARDIIKKINVGDSVAGKVISLNNKDGYIEISLKEARQALIWGEAEDAIRDKKIFELPILEANKGGLILSWQGITGFLPASQLKTETIQITHITIQIVILTIITIIATTIIRTRTSI
jgi:ribosomal protein S1